MTETRSGSDVVPTGTEWIDRLAKTWGGIEDPQLEVDTEYCNSKKYAQVAGLDIDDDRFLPVAEAEAVVSLANLRDELLAVIEAANDAAYSVATAYQEKLRDALAALKQAAEAQTQGEKG